MQDISLKFKLYFPVTYRSFSLIVVGTALFAAGSVEINNIQIFSYEYAVFFTKIFQFLGFLFSLAPIVVFLFEILAKIFKNRFVYIFFSYVIFVVEATSAILSYFLKSIAKVLLRDVVNEIIDEDRLSFDKQTTLYDTFGHDSYYSGKIDLKVRHRFKIVPQTNSDHWRVGWQFSENDFFTPERFSSNHPLFHLTKNKSAAILGVDYYDTDGRHTTKTENILGEYKCEPFYVYFRPTRNKGGFEIKVYDKDEKFLYSHQFTSLKKYKFARLSAWGDGNPYRIDVFA